MVSCFVLVGNWVSRWPLCMHAPAAADVMSVYFGLPPALVSLCLGRIMNEIPHQTEEISCSATREIERVLGKVRVYLTVAYSHHNYGPGTGGRCCIA